MALREIMRVPTDKLSMMAASEEGQQQGAALTTDQDGGQEEAAGDHEDDNDGGGHDAALVDLEDVIESEGGLEDQPPVKKLKT